MLSKEPPPVPPTLPSCIIVGLNSFDVEEVVLPRTNPTLSGYPPLFPLNPIILQSLSIMNLWWLVLWFPHIREIFPLAVVNRMPSSQAPVHNSMLLMRSPSSTSKESSGLP